MEALPSFSREGAARENGDVNALPFKPYRPGSISVAHHSQVLPHMSYTPYGLTPDW
jgi:hypothetical protein